MVNEIKKKNTFFNMYQATMDYLMTISNRPNEYNILISSKKVNDCSSKVGINIVNNVTGKARKMIPVTLSNEGVSDLMNAIRNDFIINHYITFASVNENNMTQTLQNTRFSLMFKLNTTMDFLEACEYNAKVNLNKNDINKGKMRELGLK